MSRISFAPRQTFGFCLLTLLGLVPMSGCHVASSGLNAEGTRHYLSGNHTAAVSRFHEAIQTDPGNPDSYYNLGATYHQLAKTQGQDEYWSQAENYYHQCLDRADARGQEHVDCYRALAVLLVDRGQDEDAFTLLRRWTEKRPLSADARVELARLHHEFGDEVSEEEHLLAAINLNTTHARARSALGHLREKEGDYSQALANYNVSLSSDRIQPQVAARATTLRAAAVSDPLTPVPVSPATRIVTAPDLLPIRR